MNNYFNPTRFWLLLKTEFIRSRNGILITLLISFGLQFFVGFILSCIVENLEMYEHYENFGFNLIVVGFILSSLAFKDLNNTLKRYQYLTLPASALEKFLSMWFLTSIAWIVVFTGIYSLYAVLVNLFGSGIFTNIEFQSFSPLNEQALDSIKYYFVLQGILLVGATHFKGYVFPKTILALLIFAAVCGILFYFSMHQFFSVEECTADDNPLIGTTAHQFWMFAQGLFWWALAPLCWVISYFGIKEKEV